MVKMADQLLAFNSFYVIYELSYWLGSNDISKLLTFTWRYTELWAFHLKGPVSQKG